MEDHRPGERITPLRRRLPLLPGLFLGVLLLLSAVLLVGGQQSAAAAGVASPSNQPDQDRPAAVLAPAACVITDTGSLNPNSLQQAASLVLSGATTCDLQPSCPGQIVQNLARYDTHY